MKATIKVENAITVLEKNLEAHIAEYADAIDVWTEDAKKAIDQLKEVFDRQGRKASIEAIYQLWHRQPVDNRPHYSRAIGMLKQAHEAGQTTFECDEDEYDQIFQDNWDWRRASRATNFSYSSRK